MADGPPPEYPNTAARSMPSVSRSSAYASAWSAAWSRRAGKSQVSEARRGDEPVTGADVGPREAGHHVKAPEERVAEDHRRALAPSCVLDVPETRVAQDATLAICQSSAGRVDVAAVTSHHRINLDTRTCTSGARRRAEAERR
jgi:hypothetical protein